MAKRRRNPSPRHGAARSAALGPEDGARDLMLRAAELQRAVVVTGAALAREWLGLTAGYGEQVSNAMLAAARDPQGRKDIAGEILEQYRDYVTQVAALPRIYGLRFLSEMEQSGS